MRYVYLIILIVLIAAFLAFAVVNRSPVQVNFPMTEVQLSAPLFLVMLAVYVLGMFTGGSFFGFLRQSISKASEVGHHGH
ncbi:LapA family protein [Tautonia rosea]|uniref:LapA family protein n=1 Tax=Tautonia rosea TaxID=2728037 RepID=UPI0014747A46|nr:LapA family protein [Tautonia rosea]